MRPGSFLPLLCLSSLVLAALITYQSRQHLHHLLDTRPESVDQNQREEVLYLPRGPAVQLLSLGFTNVLAHTLWFNTINYFGKHYRGNKNYRWLSHMCELVTTLYPQGKDQLRFCATMLAWEGNMAERSIEILNRAIQHHPHDWIFYYLRGFHYLYFFGEEAKGRDDFIAASKLPEVHPVIVSLASKKILASESPESSLSFLQDAYRMTSDPQMRKVYQDRIREIRYELDFRSIESAVEGYQTRWGKLPATLQELVPDFLDNLWIKSKFQDQFGGTYSLDAAGKVISSSGRAREDSLENIQLSRQSLGF